MQKNRIKTSPTKRPSVKIETAPKKERSEKTISGRRSRSKNINATETHSKSETAPKKIVSPIKAVTTAKVPVKLNRKQISALRGKVHHLNPTVLIGKEGLTAATYASIETCLRAQELIKIKCLETSLEKYIGGIKEMAGLTAHRLNAEVVQIIGHTFSIFRQKHQDSFYELDSTGVVSKKKVVRKKKAKFDKMGNFRRNSSER